MITLCLLTKNEESHIRKTIESARPFISHIKAWDDHSNDKTIEILKNLGAEVVHLEKSIRETGFSCIANRMIQEIETPWSFILDADELLTEGHLLDKLIQEPSTNAWALPRRKWEFYPKVREEIEAYPDWQIRLMRKTQENFFKGDMHIRFQGKVSYAYRGPHIEHLQRECRSSNKFLDRALLYPILADRQRVKIIGGERK